MYPIALDTFSFQERIMDLCVTKSHQVIRVRDGAPLVVEEQECLICRLGLDEARAKVAAWPAWKRSYRVTKYSRGVSNG